MKKRIQLTINTGLLEAAEELKRKFGCDSISELMEHLLRVESGRIEGAGPNNLQMHEKPANPSSGTDSQGKAVKYREGKRKHAGARPEKPQ